MDEFATRIFLLFSQHVRGNMLGIKPQKPKPTKYVLFCKKPLNVCYMFRPSWSLIKELELKRSCVGGHNTPCIFFQGVVDCVWNVMAHAQKPDFVFRRNGPVHLNRRGRQFGRLLAAEVCASAVVMLNTKCCEVVWRVLATHSIRQFPLHFPSRASTCAITFQLDSTTAALLEYRTRNPSTHNLMWQLSSPITRSLTICN
jgi:hypothetical protein